MIELYHIVHTWHLIEETYSVGEMFIYIDSSYTICINNQNEQQFLECRINGNSLIYTYTHIEAFVSDFADILRKATYIEVVNTHQCNNGKRTRCDTCQISFSSSSSKKRKVF